MYNESNVLLKKIIDFISPDTKYPSLRRQITEYFNGQENFQEEIELPYTVVLKTHFLYDKENKLLSTLTNGKNSFRLSRHYYYSNRNLTKQVEIENWGNLSDSIVYYYKYDNHNRLIEESKRPSKTYGKTFNIDCWVGLSYYYRYEYDSLNRKIFETEIREEDLGDFGYIGMAYKKIEYNTNGFTEKWFDSRNQIQETNIYNFHEINNDNVHLRRESLNHKSRLITYLSENSRLPIIIDYNMGWGGSTTYVIEYLR